MGASKAAESSAFGADLPRASEVISILDFITARADRDAVRAGTHTDDLTPVIHGALDQIQTAYGSGYGGVLYLPAGLYHCNVEIGQGGRLNVHLEGEMRGATRLKSYAAGGWAVTVLFTDATGISADLVANTRIARLSFEGGGAAWRDAVNGGLLVISPYGIDTEYLSFFRCRVGMMVMATHYGRHVRPIVYNGNIGIWFGHPGAGLTSITDPDMALPMMPADYPGRNTGDQTIVEPKIMGNRIGIVLVDHVGEGLPQFKVDGGSCESCAVGVLVPSFLTEPRGRGFDNVMTLDRLWFEGNGTVGQWNGLDSTETVNGWPAADSGDLDIGHGVVDVRDATLRAVTVRAGGALQGDLINYGEPEALFKVRWRAPLGRVLFNRASGRVYHAHGPIVRRPAPWRWAVGAAATAHVPMKLAWGRHPHVVAGEKFDGASWTPDNFLSVYGPANAWTFQVADGPIAASCAELAVAPGNLNGVRLWRKTDDWPGAGKAFALLALVKAVGEDVRLSTYASQNQHAGYVLCPADRWSTVAMCSVSGSSAGPNHAPIFGYQNGGGSIVTVRFGGLALLEFDTPEEAAEACAGELFPVF